MLRASSATGTATRTPSTTRNRRSQPRAGTQLEITIESLNARYRRAVTVRGHFPTEQAAMKCPYLVTRSLDPKGTGQTRWTMRWLEAGAQRVRDHLR